MRYPDAPRQDLVETIHGHEIADPYRWLEDAASVDTKQWLASQNGLARPYLEALPGRDTWKRRVRELMPGVISAPAFRGERMFFMRRTPEQDHAVLMLRTADGAERVLLDPNALSPDGTITLDGSWVSRSGTRLAYALSEGGDEETSTRVMDVDTGDTIDGPIDRTRYGGVAWLPSAQEFIYVRKLASDDVPAGEAQLHRRVYRHRVGTAASTDELVFGEDSERGTYFGVSVSQDGRWLLVSASVGTAPRNDLYLCHLSAGRTFVPLQVGVDATVSGRIASDGRLYLFTDLDAPLGRLLVADPSAPLEQTELVAESDAVLTDYALTDDALVAVHQRDVCSVVTIRDRATGAVRTGVALPGAGYAHVVDRPDGGPHVWIGYTDHVTPYRVFRLTTATGALEPWADPPGSMIVHGLRSRQVFYASADGTRIPMFVVSRDDVAPGAPTILNGYGGFNNAMVPAYSAQTVAWVERGGVHAIACLRGGSEYGEQWHRAGMRERKQNVFDDFIAAGEWLIAEGVTSARQLAISGGSNGGLLVGAALTQRPDLFSAVVCSAPLLDMIRYEQFGLGETWNDEYGTASDPVEFAWLRSYSPYHHVVDGTAYPSILFTVFDSDTRVDPLHAWKMCAALQHASSSGHPILLRREAHVGHGARSVTRAVDLSADVLAFVADATAG